MAISATYNPNAPAYKTGQGAAIGNREDLSSELALLAPEETPFLSICSKGTCESTFTEWNTDKLRAPRTSGRMEGQDYTAFADKFSGKARLGNYITLFGDAFSVSNLQNRANTATPGDIAAAEAKSIREVKRDMEATICSDNEMTVENGADTPYGMRGFGAWIASSAQSTNPVPADYLTPSGSILGAAPTEITLNDVIASIYTKNGEMNSLTLIAATTLRKRIAEFSRTDNNASEGVYNVMQNAESKKVTLSVQVFDSDFGMVKVVNGNPECMPSATRGYLINPKYVGVKTYIPMHSQRLENQGGGERGYVECAATLICKHPQAHGKIAY